MKPLCPLPGLKFLLEFSEGDVSLYFGRSRCQDACFRLTCDAVPSHRSRGVTASEKEQIIRIKSMNSLLSAKAIFFDVR